MTDRTYAIWVRQTSFRRSIRSASAPPQNDAMMNAGDVNRPRKPTINAESVICSSSHELAISCTQEPMLEATRPTHNRRKSRNASAPRAETRAGTGSPSETCCTGVKHTQSTEALGAVIHLGAG